MRNEEKDFLHKNKFYKDTHKHALRNMNSRINIEKQKNRK